MTGRRKGTPCACETDPCSCGSSKGKCIRTINNLSPDPNGDFFIEAGSGITITQTSDNGFEVSFDGTLPSNPVIYKGTVGSGGTVAVLPAADPDNIGWMYIAIEAAVSPVTYEVGDTLISDGYTWQVIPSGDDPVDWSQILNTPTTLAGYGITDAMQADTTPGVWAYTHSGIYQGQTAVAGNAANSLLARDSDGCGQVADPLADTDSDYAVNVRTLNRRLTDGSVSKIGTANIGSDTKPIKLVGGVPTVVTNDLVDLPSAQAITGAKTVPLEATGTFSDQIASSNKVKNELDNYAPMVRTTGNQTIAGNKTLTGLTTLCMSRIAPTGGSGFKILYRFKNDHSQTLLFTGGRSIVVAQVHKSGGYKKTLATSGRDYDNSWMWSVKDSSDNSYLIVKGQYSATMNAHVINSFLYGTVYNYLDDIEIIDQSTTDPTSDPQWITVNEVGNYD